MLDRSELAAFLRSRRDRLRPTDVGLPEVGPRRTPGLRRQEVAQVAGMSVDYYIRLEQGRGPRPSKQVLSALARALVLTVDEREYLFRVAGESPPLSSGPSRELPPAISVLLDSLSQTPAYVLDASYDVLAWNRMATYFLGDPSVVPEGQRNLIRWTFQEPDTSDLWQQPGSVRFTRSAVADLRAAYARYPGDPGIEGMVTELLATSPRFAEMWAAREVEVRRRVTKRVGDHPMVGPLEFDCQVLHVPDTDQRLIVYCAEPGSPTQAAFRWLAESDAPPPPRKFCTTAGTYSTPAPTLASGPPSDHGA